MPTNHPQKRDADIKLRYERGESYAKMEKDLGVPRGTIGGDVARMVRAGTIKPREVGRRRMPSFGEALKRQAFRGISVTSDKPQSESTAAPRTA